LQGFTAPETDYVNLMVLHGDVDSPSDTYNPISTENIAASGLDYLALGHVHTYSGIKKAGNTYYAYPGCPEGRGFDETGEKGCIIGTVDKGSCDLKFVPLGGRRYEILKVDVTGCDDIAAAVLAALPDGTERDIYRVILTGECGSVPDMASVKAAIEDKFYSVTLRDATRIQRDVWQEAYSDTLKGLFLLRLKEKYDAARDENEKQQIMLAVRYGLSALENGEEVRL
jgi:DNA repair exonuclease SbcCD nuclease subunit